MNTEPRKLAAGTFFGDRIQHYEVAGVRLSEWTYAANLQLPRHAHEQAFLNLVIEGGHTESYGTRSLEHAPFTLVFHPADEVHANRFPPAGARVLDIELDPPWLERARECGQRLDRPAEFPGGLPVWLATRLHNELYRVDSVSPLAIEGLVLELLAEISRGPSPAAERRPPSWLRQVRELLHDRFEESLSLGEIAGAVGVHPDHLTHAFRRHYHCSVGEYVRQIRIDFASRQLTTSDTPLCEIALDAGFTDQSHFTRTFRRQMGMTPAQFRRDFRVHRFDTTE